MDKRLKDDLTDYQENEYLEAIDGDGHGIRDDEDLDSEQLTQQEADQDSALETEREKPGAAGDMPEVDAAVDEVVREESDRLLKSDDDALKRQFEPPKEQKTIKSRLKNAFTWWWEHHLVRNTTFAVVFLGLAASVLLPGPRYFLLNTAGVRVATSMSIIDSETGLPLKNIPVKLQGQEKRSDDEGGVQFDGLKLGSSQLTIEKLGYAKYEKNLVLGLGSNPIGDQSLVATGAQYTFTLTDWLSGNPIFDAEASSGEDTAVSDEKGRIVLTVGKLDDDTEAVIAARGYRSVTVKLTEVADENPIAMVPAKKHTFVSNRSGKYDLYKIDVDGENEEVLLAASGQEREVPYVVPHPTKDYVAYISTRDGEVNNDGFIFDGLFIIDVESGNSKRIVRSEQLQIIGWEGDRVIYTAVTEGVSAANPERSKIFSYDIETGEKEQLATANYFNDVKLVRGRVYYSVSSYSVPLSMAKLYSIKPDGSDKQTLVDSQVWTIVWASYDTLHFQAMDENFNTSWRTQKVGDVITTTLDVPPTVQNSRFYAVAPDEKHAVWVDQRDGKGVLVGYDIASKEETVVLSTAGLDEPVYWLDGKAVVYRVSTSEETADYVVSLDGGEPRKITDVIGNRARDFY